MEEVQVSFLPMQHADVSENRALPQKVRDLRKEYRLGAHSKFTIMSTARLVSRIIQEIKPDVIHAGPIQEVAFPVALRQNQPLVSMSWGSDILQQARAGWGRCKAKFVLRRTDAFICDSYAVLQAAEQLGMDTSRAVVFPWGVDLDQFTPGAGTQLRHDLGWEEKTILLSTRNWESIYGIHDMLGAFTELIRDLPELRLLMLGDGSLRGEIKETILKNGLSDKVHLAGRIPYTDLPKYYRVSDIYVSASHSDGSSVSLLESLATGLPSVVSDIPGNREWITEGQNGFLFKDADRASLVEAAHRCLADQARWPLLARNARSVVEEKADWKKNRGKVLEAYRIALQRRRSP